MRLIDLAGKRVAVLGAGREGGAVIRALSKKAPSANVRIFDENTQPGQQLEGLPVEPFSVAALDESEVIVKSPGISKYRPELIDRTNITSATSLWFAEDHAPVLAFTGTKGKSTSSSMTAHLLNTLGISARHAGNIGQSPLDLLDEPEPEFWVLELSSFQTADLTGTPEVAAITSFSPEHLDWHGDAEHYLRDKTRLLDLARRRVINPIDVETCNLLERFPNATTPDESIELPPSKLLGKHNERLIRLALAVMKAAGVDIEANWHGVTEGIATFKPLPHRLEPAGEVNGVLYVNDSLATTPIATRAAIEAFSSQPVTVLVGGYDRGASYDELGEFIRSQQNVLVITLPDCGERIAKAIHKSEVVLHSEGLADAVRIAAERTPEGGVVLMSPGAASFGYFKDYAERGRKFVELVQDLGD